jgi:predicted O-methyltransferase YrrM
VILQEDRERLHQVAGLITLEESDRLAELAAQVPAWASIVEIGSHTGRSTLWLAAGSRFGHGAHVTAVDPWPEPGYTAMYPDCDTNDDPFEFGTGEAVFEAFCANVNAEMAWDRITVLRAASLDVACTWVNPIGLLFLDAMHGYADVKADCEAWLDKLTTGGVIALHDWYDDAERTHESQVAQALRDSWHRDSWEELGITDSLFTARRR